MIQSRFYWNNLTVTKPWEAAEAGQRTKYYIYRDAKRVGEVSGTQTTFDECVIRWTGYRSEDHEQVSSHRTGKSEEM